MVDIKIDTSGNIEIDSTTGREVLVQGDDYLAQCIMLRLKTFRGDFIAHPSMGASLERFIGTPLNDEAMNNIREAILTELSKIKYLMLNEVYVADIDENAVAVVVEFESVEDKRGTVDLLFTLDLVTGLVSQR